MSKKRNSSSQQSIDTIIKLSPNLRKNLLTQLESFDPSKNDDLLKKLKDLLEFKNKRIKELSYLEINIYQVEKIFEVLHQLDALNNLKNASNNLKEKLNKIKEETIEELLMLPAKPYLEFQTNEDINLNYGQYYTNYDYEPNNESNNESNDESNHEPNYEQNNESNDYKPKDEPNDEFNYDEEDIKPGDKQNDEFNYDEEDVKPDDQIINQTIIKSTNDEEETNKIFSFIFKYLSINDLLTCRLVNKKFKYFSDHTDGINKLIIGQPKGDYYWYYNYKLIEYKDIISLKCFRIIQKLSIFNLDKYLKYLKIYDYQFKLKEISNLINLQSIEIGHYYQNYNQQILNLNNLKVFVSSGCSVILNTPKLEKIQFRSINRIKFNSNTESIKHLITFDYGNKLVNFKNLEIMELRYRNQPIMNENLLSLFKNLRQLKINLNFEVDGVDYSNKKIKNSLIKILNDKIKLKRLIDIYLDGIKIENIDKFNELVSIKYDELWKFRLNNYDLLDLNLPFINKLDYENLERCYNNIKNDLPSSFFDKFIHINFVYVNWVKDIDSLNWFLNKLKYLNRLYIGRYVSLDEIFYNNLPNTISYLEIDNIEDINYDFILKLSELNYFFTIVDKDLFDLVFTSFLNLKYLNKFRFYYKKKGIEIKKYDKYFYLNEEDSKLDYNQLIEECNKIKLELN